MASSLHLKRVRVLRTPPPALTAEQIDHIIATANADLRLHLTGATVRFIAETGLRFNELCRLRKYDIDFSTNRLFIFAEITEGRSIPLTPQALDALQSLHSHFSSSDLVMGDKAVATLRRVAVNFRWIAAQQGIVGQGLHSLRRFCVKRLLRGGADLITVARSMGHSDPYSPILRSLLHDVR